MWLLLHGWDSGDFPHHILLQLELTKKVPDACPESPVPEFLPVLEVVQQDFQGEWLPVRDKEETLQMCRHCCT